MQIYSLVNSGYVIVLSNQISQYFADLLEDNQQLQ